MPDQRKSSLVMIEGYVVPATGIVACAAGRAELTVVCIFGGMTRVAIPRCAFIDTVGVTGLTLNARVFPGQREGCIVVVERDIRPFGGFVTGAAACAKLTVVGILGGMTRVTVLGRAFEDAIRMT